MPCAVAMQPSQEPQRLFLLGHPIGHSKSPAMYNAVYPLLGLKWEYGFADIPDEADARVFLAARDFLSVNITMPYKPHAFAAADVRDASAVLAHGANVLVKRLDGSLAAYNTDGEGCVLAIKRTGFVLDGSRVAVCGTGPTSLAIMRACALAGAAEVRLLSRSAERAQVAVERYRAECLECGAAAGEEEGHAADSCAASSLSLRVGCQEGEIEECRVASAKSTATRLAPAASARIAGGSYADSCEYLAACDLVVNATPLGMNAEDPAPFDTSVLRAGQTVFDCVYGHGTTELVRAAREAGCSTSNGASMLVAQAVATVRIVCEAAGVPVGLSDEELFAAMATAADFDC